MFVSCKELANEIEKIAVKMSFRVLGLRIKN